MDRELRSVDSRWRRRGSTFLMLFALASPFSLSGQAVAPKVESLPIVDRAIEYHGGELFDRVQVSLTVSSKSGSFDVVSRVQAGAFDYRVTESGPQGTRYFRHTNDPEESVELIENGERIPLDAERERRVKDFVSQRLYFSLMPSRLDDPHTYKQDLGLEEWEGRELHKVKVTFTPGTSSGSEDEYLYWFDPESGRLESFAYSFAGGLRYRRLYDYRRVGGILFANQENYAIDERGLSVDSIDPEYVERKMHLLSRVEFSNIEVEPLDS